MKGTILEFDARTGEGLISATDGKRYTFAGAEFKGDIGKARSGVEVDFQLDGDTAKALFPIAASASGQVGEKSKIVAGLLGILLGGLGIHKFYIGATKAGVIMLVVSILGFVLLAIPTIIIGVIGFVEGVLYMVKSDEEFHETYEINKKAWF